jgi:hypothetical protein
MDEFNNNVRRLANLIAYDQDTGDAPKLLVVAATLFNQWAPFPMPDEPLRFGMEASGEFTAR